MPTGVFLNRAKLHFFLRDFKEWEGWTKQGLVGVAGVVVVESKHSDGGGGWDVQGHMGRHQLPNKAHFPVEVDSSSAGPSALQMERGWYG